MEVLCSVAICSAVSTYYIFVMMLARQLQQFQPSHPDSYSTNTEKADFSV